MKSKLSLVLALLLTLSLLLAGCGCKHEWKDATCTDPKTCSLCNVTEGEKLGHTWVDANCEAPKTCSVCKVTEGEKLDHVWEDATTEAPKTCTLCKKTEGEKINTDARFKTANNKEFFGEWKGVVEIDGKKIVDKDFVGKLELEYAFTFKNDGTFESKVTLLNEEAFTKSVEEYYINVFYTTFKDLGLTETQADEAMKAQYGKDVKEYSKVMAAAIDFQDLFDASAETMGQGVYYAADGKLYSGEKWTDTLEEEGYTITETTLVLDSLKEDHPDLVFTRVAK